MTVRSGWDAMEAVHERIEPSYVAMASMLMFLFGACGAAERDLQQGDAGTKPCADATAIEACGLCPEGFHPEEWLRESCSATTDLWRCRQDCGSFIRCRPTEGCPTGWVETQALEVDQCGLSDPSALVCEPAPQDSGACSPNPHPCPVNQCAGTASDGCGGFVSCGADCGMLGQCPCAGGACSGNYCACNPPPCI
jgi:hypothetical protein